MHPTLPTPRGLSPIAAAQRAEERYGDAASLEASAGALEVAREKLEIQLKGVVNDKAIELIQEAQYHLEDIAAKMRVLASDIQDGYAS